MIRIRRKKKKCDECETCAPAKPRETEGIESDAQFVGAYPGMPWERLTNIRHGRGSRMKILEPEDQKKVVDLAKKYFGFQQNDFPRARIAIQSVLDRPDSDEAKVFFQRALILDKRLIVRAYLSDADGRFVDPGAALPLLKHFADSGLDFEVGAIDHFIDGERKTEFVIGDGTEVISDKGYWFAHTHPAKAGITNNVLPSLADLDVMIMTARGRALHLDEDEHEFYVMRDIGSSKVSILTSKGPPPSSAVVEKIVIEWHYQGGADKAIQDHAVRLVSHLRTRHKLQSSQIEVRRVSSSVVSMD
jgi:hypothetical protein